MFKKTLNSLSMKFQKLIDLSSGWERCFTGLLGERKNRTVSRVTLHCFDFVGCLLGRSLM